MYNAINAIEFRVRVLIQVIESAPNDNYNFAKLLFCLAKAFCLFNYISEFLELRTYLNILSV